MTRQNVVPGTRTAFDSSFLAARVRRARRRPNDDARRPLEKSSRPRDATTAREARRAFVITFVIAFDAFDGDDVVRDGFARRSFETPRGSVVVVVVVVARSRRAREGANGRRGRRGGRRRRVSRAVGGASATVDGALGARARVDGTFGATTTRTRGGWGCGDAGGRGGGGERRGERARARGTRGERRGGERGGGERDGEREREGQGRGEGVSRAFEHRHGGERVRAVQ